MKKGIRWLLLALTIFLLAGCHKEAVQEEQEPEQTEETEAAPEDQAADGTGGQEVIPDDTQTEDGQQETQTEPDTQGADSGIRITVYYGNEDMTGFEQEEMEISSLSSEQVLAALVKKGVVAADVSIISFREFEREGEKVLDIDFSEEFQSYMQSIGSSAEYYVIGSICNTYMDAYECEKVHITVNGEVLATGHAEYPGYLQRFQ